MVFCTTLKRHGNRLVKPEIRRRRRYHTLSGDPAACRQHGTECYRFVRLRVGQGRGCGLNLHWASKKDAACLEDALSESIRRAGRSKHQFRGRLSLAT